MKIFNNKRYVQCVNCKYIWRIKFWQWLCLAPQIDNWNYRYVKCPRCGARHWLRAEGE